MPSLGFAANQSKGVIMSLNRRSTYVLVAEPQQSDGQPKFWSEKHQWTQLKSASLTVGELPERIPASLPSAGEGYACRWVNWPQACALINPNENVLEGFSCPNCGSFGPFKILASMTAWVRVSDDGTDPFSGDTEWDDDAPCECTECGHEDLVARFHSSDDGLGAGAPDRDSSTNSATAGRNEDGAGEAQALRVRATQLLLDACRRDKLQPFLVTHQHNYGATSYVCWNETPPTEQEVTPILESAFEPERGESLTIEDQVRLDELTGADHVGRLDVANHKRASQRVMPTRTRSAWEMMVPVLSTAHLPCSDALNKLGGPLPLVCGYPEGAFVFLGTDGADDWPSAPWFAAIVAWFRAQYGEEQYWLRFDQAADPIDGLAVFNW